MKLLSQCTRFITVARVATAIYSSVLFLRFTKCLCKFKHKFSDGPIPGYGLGSGGTVC